MSLPSLSRLHMSPLSSSFLFSSLFLFLFFLCCVLCVDGQQLSMAGGWTCTLQGAPSKNRQAFCWYAPTGAAGQTTTSYVIAGNWLSVQVARGIVSDPTNQHCIALLNAAGQIYSACDISYYGTTPLSASNLTQLAVGQPLTFQTMTLSYDWICGIDTRAKVTCEQTAASSQTTAPPPVSAEYSFTLFSVASRSACGVLTNQTILCYMPLFVPRASVPYDYALYSRDIVSFDSSYNVSLKTDARFVYPLTVIQIVTRLANVYVLLSNGNFHAFTLEASEASVARFFPLVLLPNPYGLTAYVSFALGGTNSDEICGITTEATLICRSLVPSSPVTSVPLEYQFSQIAVGSFAACGLAVVDNSQYRVNASFSFSDYGSVVCWPEALNTFNGLSGAQRTDVAQITYASVSVEAYIYADGNAVVYARRSINGVSTRVPYLLQAGSGWSYMAIERINAYNSLSSEICRVCGLTSNGNIVCTLIGQEDSVTWLNTCNATMSTAPFGGPAVNTWVSLGFSISNGLCARSSSGTVLCVSEFYSNSSALNPPTGITFLARGGAFSCGVKSLTTPLCWGGGWKSIYGPPPPASFWPATPQGKTISHIVNTRYSYFLQYSDGTTWSGCYSLILSACLASNIAPPPPTGTSLFQSVLMVPGTACGALLNGTVICWRANGATGQLPQVPAGVSLANLVMTNIMQFSQEFWCAFTTDSFPRRYFICFPQEGTSAEVLVPPLYATGLAPRGYYREGRVNVPCAGGTYILSAGLSSRVCSGLCRAGYYGTAAVATGYSTTPTCTAICPVGRYCPKGTTVPLDCAAGYFGSSLGLTTPQCTSVCPDGYFCPAGTAVGTSSNCPGGTYGGGPGMSSLSGCLGCLAGFYCPPASTIDSLFECGDQKVYCPANSTAPSYIGPGYYGVNSTDPFRPLKTISGRQLCEAGYFCDGSGLRQVCPSGSYSEAGDSRCTPCVAGTVASAPGQSACDRCPAGSTSDANRTTCVLCGAGSYTMRVTGNPSCLLCSPGTAVNVTGYFIGMTRLDSCPLCTFGKFAQSAGRAVCSDCPAGSYSPTEGASRCPACPKGTYCPSTGTVTPTPCPPGTFNNVSGMTSVDDCTQCPAGFWCPEGAMSPTPCGRADVFCPSGAQFPRAVNPGWYAANPGDPNAPSQTFSIQIQCSSGSYCPGGSSPSLCPAGTFSRAGAAYCTSCPPGTFSDSPGTANLCSSCRPGYFQSASNSTSCDPCSPGTYQDDYGAPSCKTCPPGSFNNATASSVRCTLCAPGRFANTSSSIDCMDCAAGKYSSSSGAVACQSCTPSYWCPPATSSPTANPCPAGRWSDVMEAADASVCKICPKGYWCPIAATNGTANPCGSATVYCPLGSASPLPINNGWYGINAIDGTNRTFSARAICAPGYFCPGNGLQTPCPMGQFSGEKYGYCSSCLPGTFSNITGGTVCFNCTAGRFASNAEAKTCDACPAGSFSTQIGASNCQPCPPGSSSAQVGLSTQCPSCKAGEYSPMSGQTSCLKCTGSMYSSAPNSVACLNCDQGLIDLDHTSCDLSQTCPRNYYRRTGIPGVSGAVCWKCSLGLFSNGGDCTVCPRNTYTPRRGFDCIACDDEGLDCSNGIASAKPGYWAYQVTVMYTPTITLTNTTSSNYHAIASSSPLTRLHSSLTQLASSLTSPFQFTPQEPIAPTTTTGTAIPVRVFRTSLCPSRSMCVGGVLQLDDSSFVSNSSEIEFIQAEGNGTVVLDAQCQPPRQADADNVLCGTCAEGYVSWGNRCVQCEGNNEALIFAYFVISIFITFFLLKSSASTTGYAVIFIYFLQIAQLEIGGTGANNSSTSSSSSSSGSTSNGEDSTSSPLLNWLKFINLDAQAIQNSCLAPLDNYDQTILSLMIPFILLVELWVVYIIHLICYYLFEAQFSFIPQYKAMGASFCSRVYGNWLKLAQSVSVYRYVAGSFSVLLFCYTQIASTSLGYYWCVSIAGKRVSFSTPAIDCNSDKYKLVEIPVLFVLITYVAGFPLFAFLLLGWKKKFLHFPIVNANTGQVIAQPIVTDTQTAAPNGGSASRAHSPLNVSLLPLFAMFTNRSFFWTSALLLRRLAFSIVSVTLMREATARAFAYQVLHVCSLAMQLTIHPFAQPVLNRWEIVSHVGLMLLSALLTAYPAPYSYSVTVAILFLVVPLALFFFFASIRYSYKDMKEKRLEKSRRKLAHIDRDEINQELTEMKPTFSPSGIKSLPLTARSKPPHRGSNNSNANGNGNNGHTTDMLSINEIGVTGHENGDDVQLTSNPLAAVLHQAQLDDEQQKHVNHSRITIS